MICKDCFLFYIGDKDPYNDAVYCLYTKIWVLPDWIECRYHKIWREKTEQSSEIS